MGTSIVDLCSCLSLSSIREGELVHFPSEPATCDSEEIYGLLPEPSDETIDSGKDDRASLASVRDSLCRREGFSRRTWWVSGGSRDRLGTGRDLCHDSNAAANIKKACHDRGVIECAARCLRPLS